MLVLGPLLRPEEGRDLLLRRSAEFPGVSTENVVLCGAEAPELYQEFIDEDQIFYLTRGALPEPQVHSILRAAVARFGAKTRGESESLAASAGANDRLLGYCMRIPSQSDLRNLTGLLTEAASTLVRADGAQCLVYNQAEDVLSAMDPETGELRIEAAAAGLVGFVARTGERVNSRYVANDARYDASSDNPGGSGDACFIAEPIYGVRNELLGVITAVRNGKQSPFSTEDAKIISVLAGCAAPTLDQILLQNRLQAMLVDRTPGVNGSSEIFREEALDYHIRKWDQEGDVLRTAPTWLKRTHWVMVGIVVLAVAYMSLAKVDEYATGPAVVRARAKVNVSAPAAGLVRSLDVSVGDHVRSGDPLVEITGSPGPTLLESVHGILRATSNGIISDVWVRPGQHVSANDQAASIIDESAGYEVIALLPGSYAPQLRPGIPLRLKVDGYSDSAETVEVDRVGAEVVGPREAARYAGRDSGDGLVIAGPIVIVHASLKSLTFQANHGHYSYKDGMGGRAEASVRSERIIVTLVPGLKGLLR